MSGGAIEQSLVKKSGIVAYAAALIETLVPNRRCDGFEG